MKNKENCKTIRNISIFTFVVLISGWVGVFIDKIANQQPNANGSLGMLIWLVSPLFASILLRAFAGDGWHDIGFLPRFKGNLKWYAVSILIYPVITFITMLIGNIFGWVDISALNAKTFITVIVSGLIAQFIKNFFEESVWRGYLTSKLLKFKLNDFWLYIIVGSIWGLWHTAYFMVFLPESDIYSTIPVSRLMFALISIPIMICWTVMYTEIYRMTKSIWPLIIVHTMEDVLVNPLIINGYVKIVQGKEILISPSVGVITTLLYLLVGLVLRRCRIKKELQEVSVEI